MKKYTVYEIEKLTNGKVTKYKLNQAIQKGELTAEFVEGGKKGRGMPKYFVNEDELRRFLAKISEQKKNKLPLPEPENSSAGGELVELRQRISLLETKLSQDDSRSAERRELIVQLAGVSIFAVQKRKHLLTQLSKLS